VGLEITSFGIGQSINFVKNARNLTASEKLFLNSVIFKTQGVGQFGAELSGRNQ
jgi:hypothetical protein